LHASEAPRRRATQNRSVSELKRRNRTQVWSATSEGVKSEPWATRGTLQSMLAHHAKRGSADTAAANAHARAPTAAAIETRPQDCAVCRDVASGFQSARGCVKPWSAGGRCVSSAMARDEHRGSGAHGSASALMPPPARSLTARAARRAAAAASPPPAEARTAAAGGGARASAAATAAAAAAAARGEGGHSAAGISAATTPRAAAAAAEAAVCAGDVEAAGAGVTSPPSCTAASEPPTSPPTAAKEALRCAALPSSPPPSSLSSAGAAMARGAAPLGATRRDGCRRYKDTGASESTLRKMQPRSKHIASVSYLSVTAVS